MNTYRMCLTLAAILILSVSAATNIVVADQPAENKQSLEGLIAACQDAKSQFRPLTQEDLKSAKDELVAALDRLDPKLKADGANGDDSGTSSSRNCTRMVPSIRPSSTASASATPRATKDWGWSGSSTREPPFGAC